MPGRAWLRWRQWIGLPVALLSICVVALVPRPALAACGALDVGACVDAAEYSFYYGIASIGWAIDRNQKFDVHGATKAMTRDQILALVRYVETIE